MNKKKPQLMRVLSAARLVHDFHNLNRLAFEEVYGVRRTDAVLAEAGRLLLRFFEEGIPPDFRFQELPPGGGDGIFPLREGQASGSDLASAVAGGYLQSGVKRTAYDSISRNRAAVRIRKNSIERIASLNPDAADFKPVPSQRGGKTGLWGVTVQGGKYLGQINMSGKTFRVYHVDPVEAQKAVLRKARSFFLKNRCDKS